MSDAATAPTPHDGGASCPRCAELEAEINELRALAQTLRAKNDELARALVNRDYERPPHYL
jgi:hypothetical protein